MSYSSEEDHQPNIEDDFYTFLGVNRKVSVSDLQSVLDLKANLFETFDFKILMLLGFVPGQRRRDHQRIPEVGPNVSSGQAQGRQD